MLRGKGDDITFLGKLSWGLGKEGRVGEESLDKHPQTGRPPSITSLQPRTLLAPRSPNINQKADVDKTEAAAPGQAELAPTARDSYMHSSERIMLW